MPVWRGGRGERERTPGRTPHEVRHVAEVVGHKVARTLVKSLAVSRGEKLGDVPHTVEVAVHVGALRSASIW